jgi:uncharacterized MAPEG superfamily protein
MAGLPTKEMNRFAFNYLVIRALYTLLYIKTTRSWFGYVRSAVFFVATAMCVSVLGRAGGLMVGN